MNDDSVPCHPEHQQQQHKSTRQYDRHNNNSNGCNADVVTRKAREACHGQEEAAAVQATSGCLRNKDTATRDKWDYCKESYYTCYDVISYNYATTDK